VVRPVRRDPLAPRRPGQICEPRLPARTVRLTLPGSSARFGGGKTCRARPLFLLARTPASVQMARRARIPFFGHVQPQPATITTSTASRLRAPCLREAEWSSTAGRSAVEHAAFVRNVGSDGPGPYECRTRDGLLRLYTTPAVRVDARVRRGARRSRAESQMDRCAARSSWTLWNSAAGTPCPEGRGFRTGPHRQPAPVGTAPQCSRTCRFRRRGVTVPTCGIFPGGVSNTTQGKLLRGGRLRVG